MLCPDGFNDATLQMLPRVLRPGIERCMKRVPCVPQLLQATEMLLHLLDMLPIRNLLHK